MKERKPVERDPLEAAIETALRLGQFIDWRMESMFTSGLHGIVAQIERVVLTDPERARSFYESLLAGCYEKAEEMDDDGYFGVFVEGFYRGWVKARQTAGSDPDKTARLLLDCMENDPYGYISQLEREIVKVLNEDVLAAFERVVKILFEAKECTEQARSRWGAVLRAAYLQQQEVPAYIVLCEQAGFSAKDCLALAVMHTDPGKPTMRLPRLNAASKQTRGSFASQQQATS